MGNKILVSNGKIVMGLNGKIVIQGGSSPSIPDYLCFTANTAGSTVELVRMGSPNIENTAYSRDGQTWQEFIPALDDGRNVVTLANIGDKVYFRNDIKGEVEGAVLHFSLTGSVSASGNCNSMYSSTNFENISTLAYSYCFGLLFGGCTSLTSAPKLPATTLSASCYDMMFYGCSNLTQAPELPATTLADHCYANMFYGCSSLVTAPALPATTLKEYSYSQMFRSCTSLVNAPAISATALDERCCEYMFAHCTSLTTAPALLATTLANYCYRYMFLGCSGLTTPPELPATILATKCYESMFEDCASLYVSDVQTAQAGYEWRIPKSGVFASTFQQDDMFVSCLGERETDTLLGVQGHSYVYYTQNTPVGPAPVGENYVTTTAGEILQTANDENIEFTA